MSGQVRLQEKPSAVPNRAQTVWVLGGPYTLPEQRGCFRTTRGRLVRPVDASVSPRQTRSTGAGLRETRVRGDPVAKDVGPPCDVTPVGDCMQASRDRYAEPPPAARKTAGNPRHLLNPDVTTRLCLMNGFLG
jgi:hypothetical protein